MVLSTSDVAENQGSLQPLNPAPGPHSEHHFPAPSSTDVVNQCLEFAPGHQGDKRGTRQSFTIGQTSSGTYSVWGPWLPSASATYAIPSTAIPSHYPDAFFSSNVALEAERERERQTDRQTDRQRQPPLDNYTPTPPPPNPISPSAPRGSPPPPPPAPPPNPARPNGPLLKLLGLPEYYKEEEEGLSGSHVQHTVKNVSAGFVPPAASFMVFHHAT